MHYKTDQKNVLSVQYQLFQLFHIFFKFCYLSSFNYDNIVAGKNMAGINMAELPKTAKFNLPLFYL